MSKAALGVAMTSTGGETVARQIGGVGDSSTGMASTLVQNKHAITELTRGMMQLGMSTMMVGVALKESHNQLISNIGGYVMLAGGIMSAIGSAAMFIRAITLITDALKRLTQAEILAKAFSGPAGWAMLGIGAVAAAGTAVGVSKYESSSKRTQGTITATMGGKKVGSVTYGY